MQNNDNIDSEFIQVNIIRDHVYAYSWLGGFTGLSDLNL